jgi:hypothetical protein
VGETNINNYKLTTMERQLEEKAQRSIQILLGAIEQYQSDIKMLMSEMRETTDVDQLHTNKTYLSLIAAKSGLEVTLKVIINSL